MPLTIEFQSTADLLRKLRGMPRGEERDEIEAELLKRDDGRPRSAENVITFDDGHEMRIRYSVPRFNYSML